MAGQNRQKIISKLPFVTLTIVAASTIVFFSPELASLAIYDRAALLKGQIWRLLSAHLVHFNTPHLIYNLLALSIAGWILEALKRFHFALFVLLTSLLISSSLFILHPDMLYYGSLSGLAFGSIFYCALWSAETKPRWKTASKLVILFLPIKICLEVYSNHSILPYPGLQNFTTMPTAHLAGISAAFLFHMATNKSRTCRKSSSHIQKMHKRHGSTTS